MCGVKRCGLAGNERGPKPQGLEFVGHLYPEVEYPTRRAKRGSPSSLSGHATTPDQYGTGGLTDASLSPWGASLTLSSLVTTRLFKIRGTRGHPKGYVWPSRRRPDKETHVRKMENH